MSKGIATIRALNDGYLVLSVKAEGYQDDNVVVTNKTADAQSDLFSQLAGGRTVGDVIDVEIEIISPQTSIQTHLGIVAVVRQRHPRSIPQGSHPKGIQPNPKRAGAGYVE